MNVAKGPFIVKCYVLYHLQVNVLLLKTQMEAFAVSMRRQLPSMHPIFQLLSPHLNMAMAANSVTKEMLKGRLKLLQKKYKAFKFGMLSLPEILKERGVDNGNQLPNFHYR